MRGPQRVECRHGDEHLTVGDKEARGAPQHRLGALNVFEHIEHQDEIEPAARRERVEIAQMDTVAPASALLHGNSIGLDALDMSEHFERIEEQPGATADVEDPRARPVSENLPHFLQQNLLADAPPPMPAIQIAVGGGVLGLHYFAPSTRATI